MGHGRPPVAAVQCTDIERCAKTFPYRHFSTFAMYCCYFSVIPQSFRRMIHFLLQKIET